MSTNLATKSMKRTKQKESVFKAALFNLFQPVEDTHGEFFQNIMKVQQEMSDAENFFDNVTDPELIDHAIFRMEAARSKYVYLIKQAKEKGIACRF